VLQTAGTGCAQLLQNDKRGVAGGDGITAWTDIFASPFVSQFDCLSIGHGFSSTFKDFLRDVEPDIHETGR